MAQEPFKLLSQPSCSYLLDSALIRDFAIGSRILRPDELPSEVLLVLKGEVRLLIGSGIESNTLCKRGPGQFLGWSSLLRAEPCEWIQASTEVTIIAFSSEVFVQCVLNELDFAEFFARLAGLQEAHTVATAAGQLHPKLCRGWDNNLINRCFSARSCTVEQTKVFIPPDFEGSEDFDWFMSSAGVQDFPVGIWVESGSTLPTQKDFLLSYRLIGLKRDPSLPVNEQVKPLVNTSSLSVQINSTNLYSLGILEADDLEDKDSFPIIRGRGDLTEALAVTHMVALHEGVPFRKDIISKVLDDQLRRDKGISLEMLGSLCEMLGLRSHLAEINAEHITAIELPAVLILDKIPVILYGFRRGKYAVLGHPHSGFQKMDLEELKRHLGDRFRFLLSRKIGSTPTSSFGWNWFTPLVGKYKKALVIVFVTSLLAQLFGLAIPLLIQQIIDKVLSQGNLSSLNVLGGAMVVMALFQGLLTVLRSYIFVDTTDRMDLTLGSAVIDRLLSLPLTYFEKRPVGELSQRLGELNVIRGFLTGTALVSVLNIVFAVLYLAVMLVYSPLLTAVALSTLPLYIILVFGVAPIYKNLIRKRAVAQAKTQSHLIEILSGIETVKAQHFEITARWKWQDRYRHFVDEGFKSVALGSASGEIGKFLNQLSGLLILWVGMWLVLKGDFTLGQLIAFRIIAGNVTGPLLQLSGLYQSFQTVQLSMERLSDVLDQTPELGKSEYGQIAIPAIQGDVRFEDVLFRFGSSGPYQVQNVSIGIQAGSFVGIVGQSGSGKSTLMKLLPRLYPLEQGRIFIDDYDIAKVDLSSLRRQIGIVPQDSLLFEGTVAENISLNDPQASTESILEAARIACAHDFIMSLGQGYATPIAERGGNLSGGQRQRIAIARTILANPQMLVMDEATSALDFDTERQLCLNLQIWAKGRTVFFITHRLSTIRSSDVILVMHQGRLEEYGTHKELQALSGRYAALSKQQDTSMD